MKTTIQSIVCVIVLVVAAGCSTKFQMVNTSPVKKIPVVDNFDTIPATLLVQSEDPEDMVKNDVSEALKKHNIFKKVNIKPQKKYRNNLQLIVSSTSQSDLHFGTGLGKAVLSGLTLGLGSFAQTDPYDFSVTVKALLQKNDRTVAEYETTGSYHSEVPQITPLSKKQQRIKVAIQNSYDHALTLLAAHLKQDRKKIVTALRK